MSILDIFGSRNEQQNIIGRVDCTEENITSVFLGLASSMGMTNPTTTTAKSKKGISVTKKDGKYTLVLEMFDPPKEVVWNEPIAFSKMIEFINKIALNNKKIGWINILNLSDGSKFIQFAID